MPEIEAANTLIGYSTSRLFLETVKHVQSVASSTDFIDIKEQTFYFLNLKIKPITSKTEDRYLKAHRRISYLFFGSSLNFITQKAYFAQQHQDKVIDVWIHLIGTSNALDWVVKNLLIWEEDEKELIDKSYNQETSILTIKEYLLNCKVPDWVRTHPKMITTATTKWDLVYNREVYMCSIRFTNRMMS